MTMFFSDWMDLFCDAAEVCTKYGDVRKCRSIGSCNTCCYNRENQRGGDNDGN